MVQARSWNWVGVFAFICGAAVIIPAHTTHWFMNTGQTPTRQVVVLASAEYAGPDAECALADDPRPLVCLPPLS